MNGTNMEYSGLERLPVATAVYGYENGVLSVKYLNLAAMKLWNCTEDEVRNVPSEKFFERIHPQDIPLFSRLRQVCECGDDQVDALAFRMVDGHEIAWIQMDLSTVVHEDDSVTIYTTMTDVTKEREVANQLYIKEEESRIASEHHASNIFRYYLRDKSLHIVTTEGENQTPYVIENVPNSLIEGGIIAPESITQMCSFFEGVHNKKRQGSQRILCVVDGVHKLYYIHYTLMRDVNQEDAIAVGVFQDITGLKRRKTDNDPSQGEGKLFQLVASHARKHIFRYDHHTQKVMSMRTEGEMSTIESWLLEYINHQNVTHVTEEFRPKLTQFQESMLRGDPVNELEYMVMEERGPRWHKSIFTNMFDEDGKLSYAVISCEDCTEERERAKAYAIYRQEKASMGEGDSMMEYSVTRRQMMNVSGLDDVPHARLNAGEMLTEHVSKYVVSQDGDKVKNFYDAQRMETSFRNGIRREELEYRILYQGEIHWMLSSMLYYQDPYSDEVMALMSTRMADDRHAAMERLRPDGERDSLTGLYSCQSFQDKVDEACILASGDAPGKFILIRFQPENNAGQRIGFSTLWNHFKKCGKALDAVFSHHGLVGKLDGYQFGIYLQNVMEENELEEKLQLVLEIMEYRRENELFVRPYFAEVDCLNGEENMLGLWQRASELVDRELWGLQPEHKKKAPPVPYDEESAIFIRTFGFFDVFVDGQAIHFKTAKAKELLAILVNRCGGVIGASEGAMMLYEDEPYDERLKSKYRKVVMRLHEILRENGIDHIVGRDAGSRRLNTRLVNCDYYRYLADGTRGEGLFNGAYMSNYSWGEETLATLVK